jgi:hypothetical protein
MYAYKNMYKCAFYYDVRRGSAHQVKQQYSVLVMHT